MVTGLPHVPPRRAQRGATLIEVLVTLLIVAFGLFGLVGLHARMQTTEMEAYQRSQALTLLDDMASRITTNRRAALSYVTGSPLGAGAACPSATGTRQQIDAAEWCNALLGAGETSGTSKVGAVIGGRGCVESLGNDEYLVTVAWQGLVPLAAPSAGVACGKNQYDDANTRCKNDLCRRTVTTLVRIGKLS
ncbi:prepilin-type N-terminal cleavage/methylation domain-containing protein [Variovorax sp. J31P179]|uniref:prepilin-type N-terminal cleavage/methylation domain-containing protein n=1 Tax=Variovorax sp. J31P179 TaxID=3053508 RepID=UPI002575458F|nr:prepilin-type N-terminal cleavage/methylation domain-containing protein [Variovorax sp. J31P179]MDM0080871.1 prepilin-type N-terminal cleavage/methylation domain-containing protein [Variovorax sp. J31P179]